MGDPVSGWRDELSELLNGNVDAFNPVVDDWNEEAAALEIEKRKTSDIVLYVLTPESNGTYSIAEVVQDSNIRPLRTVLVVLDGYGGKAFSKHDAKAFRKIAEMVNRNGASSFTTLAATADFLNNL